MVSTWTAGGNLGTARRESAGAGTQTSALIAGGYTTVAMLITQKNTMDQHGLQVEI
jgi:hypothetical protein